MDFFLQLAVILACLLYGARGGIALGYWVDRVMILVFGFHLQPGKPPVDVMLVIIAVVAASATLQARAGWTSCCRSPNGCCDVTRAMSRSSRRS